MIAYIGDLHEITYLLQAQLYEQCSYCPHFTEEGTGAQRGHLPKGSQLASEVLDLNSGILASENLCSLPPQQDGPKDFRSFFLSFFYI